ncbi:hypothetical protein CI15_33790 [Paraburkholderia monticola]|uniref:DUF4148 domain-containing protein n=1 Tax=Paraburkholderia monticola TaxID=1399968 RepID=A0A149PBU0_9BURK|nr:hypothetical protein [Paraburkholderia monticola]KXU82498.1 hypothetical protein CI15_33790 [Paraburkholderia monticola]
MIFTGLVVGALAVGGYAYVSQSKDDSLSTYELGLTHGGDSTSSSRGDIISGRITRGPVAAGLDSTASVAARVQAARNSLLRDDVVAARAQLNAVRPAHEREEPVIDLQKQIQAQAVRDQRALAAAQASEVPRTLPPSSTPLKIGDSHGSRSAAHEHWNRASSYAKSGRPTETVKARARNDGGSSGSVSVANAQAVSSQPVDVRPALKPGESVANAANAPTASAALNAPNASQAMQQTTQAVQTTPSNPPAELSAQTALPPRVVQPAPSTDTLPKPDSGPKTRAQVRAEIARAREDGSLPVFGNPDPAGPAGAPRVIGAVRP